MCNTLGKKHRAVSGRRKPEHPAVNSEPVQSEPEIVPDAPMLVFEAEHGGIRARLKKLFGLFWLVQDD
ncbi:hypothetical protein [Oceanospirillum sediminis]|uniref:Uncharacterized protein n=1 Tax=Oceanospirillum sediminis TaxID=2760088 RepID=A0A839IQW3_9GAMM|nr:hypothetical protein [Oceanospirillum sediminis]MBB1487655.1 hypothetical protein [Oceanospirillum sediminis]